MVLLKKGHKDCTNIILLKKYKHLFDKEKTLSLYKRNFAKKNRNIYLLKKRHKDCTNIVLLKKIQTFIC